MCSVIGVSGNWEIAKVKEIFKWSRVRGLHAFGFSYVKQNELITKKFLDWNEFVISVTQIKPEKFIAHFRYSTSGDWKEPNNNQPITAGEWSLIFNGVIDMGTKEEMEARWNLELTGENDGEIALRKWERGQIGSLIKLRGITFAGIVLNSKNEMIAVRNNSRPLHQVEEGGATYISSTSDILKRSGFDATKIEILKEYEQYKY